MNQFQASIDNRLKGSLADNLTPLFCETLFWGKPRGMSPLSLPIGMPINKTLTAQPVAQISGLPVLRVDWPDDLLPGVTARRIVQRQLASVHAEHLLCYLTRDGRQAAFTWAHRRTDGKTELRTLPYEVGSPARTTIEQLAKLAFTLQELEPDGRPPISVVIDKLNAAFDVQAVTQQFYEDYKKVFTDLQARLYQAGRNKQWAHDYALQLLNRLMFLYFIQRKRWLGDNPRFLADFWRAYQAAGQPQNTFFNKWLSVLFFEAFNNKFHGGHRHFSDEIRSALAAAPYLNGGLFTRNDLDDQYDTNIPDDFFTALFDRFGGSTPGFLERYNFTISESTPLDIEVAVDPEMIGQVYESLVNITTGDLDEQDHRGSAGIFYTPRVEIDLMCRLALVDALANHLGADKKPLLYDAVFAYDPGDKDAADRALAAQNLWPDLSRLLRETTVCDPACGSGSFLVGMLLVLDDLQARADAQLGIEETPYERRRRIIGEQLYGVDVMDWAVHVAELRLWLQLVVETELNPAELRFRPLLPNLSFKVRCGDSLVQQIGGINFGLHRHHLDIPPPLKGRLTQLKGKKLRFYQGEPGLREADLNAEELAVFRDILSEKRLALQNDIKKLTRQIEFPQDQLQMVGFAVEKAGQEAQKRQEQLRAQRDEKEAELARIEAALDALRRTHTVPFVWDIAFVEIFEGDKAGFDIVIGNPPYVRQEAIAPPALDPAEFGGEASDRWKEQKKAYKAKLQESVAAAWPKFFRYKPGRADFRKPDGKSDLYIYFYLHGLSLLNPAGSFCFITSNSWLDVGYGADLQEFLLKHSHVKFILDNEKKRSFAQADVNTVIALLAPADDRSEVGLKNTARFVMFKVPFEDVLSAETFKTLEAVGERRITDQWRINAVAQRDLLEEGLVHEEEEDETAAKIKTVHIKTARYEANKWGGKYLRAPEIFFTILEKGKGKLVRLGDIAKVRRGFTTGANEFFYLDDEKIAEWGIEPEFLKLVIKSPRECRSIIIKPEDLRYKIFMCRKDKRELKGTNALEYIKWGESRKFHLRPSCRGRQRWWECPEVKGNTFWGKELRERIAILASPSLMFADCRLYVATVDRALQAVLNSAVAILSDEVNARNYGGGGGPRSLMVYEVQQQIVLLPSAFNKDQRLRLVSELDRLGCREIFPIFDEILQPDRRALDDAVFDVLGLTAGEREAVYEAVVSLVRARLEKAQSV
ncbi:MAG: Eco57I restriction-modification methylase domain-containing protein [candidate division KSB1 bacterium]|nr:Eco57I restriction-modification methylase domain-containing protein [candidate division KSB1 bacterium]